jgi:hypothetical protein
LRVQKFDFIPHCPVDTGRGVQLAKLENLLCS